MKRIELLIVVILMSASLWGQAPTGFSYQAIIRQSSGAPIAGQLVNLKITLQDEEGNSIYYSESHLVTTTPQGAVALTVGEGTMIEGDFSVVPWSAESIHLRVEVDPNGGTNFSQLGLTKLQAVPYALFAADGNQGPQGEPGVDGVGISSTVDNGDGTFTINYSDGSSFTTSNLTGTPGTSIEWLGSQNDFPSNPALNQAFYHSTERKAFIYSDNSWQVLAQDGSPGEQGPSGETGTQGPQGEQGIQGEQGLQGSQGDPGTPIQWRGSYPSHPSSGLNYAYYNSSDGASYIFDGSMWQAMTFDGQQGPQGEQGISIEWLGSLAEAPSASVNQAFYHTLDKKAYIWDGDEWQILAVDGLQGAIGPQGPKGETGAAGTGLTNRGSWVLGAEYNPGDYVFALNSGSTGNSMWIVQAEEAFTSTVAPADDTEGNWIEFEAPSGEDGADGMSIQWLGTHPSAPSSPETNQAYYNSTDRKSYIWYSNVWQIIAQDGQHGISISWQGSLASAPAGGLNRAYYNTILKKSFIHNGTTWMEMTQDGKTMLSGTANPSGSDGINGDFYLNTTTSTLFGPKSGGVWPAGVPLVGPIGPQGPQGIQGEQGIQGIQGETGLQGEQGLQGIAGLDGRTVLSGTADPTGGIGIDGDFYINTTTNYIFGPKIEGSWPAGVSLIGPQGEAGEEGPLVAGTQGQSLVHNGTSWAATSNLFTDASENVGIGTTAPTEKLDVEGNIRARGKLMGETIEIDQPETQEEEPIFVVRNKAGQIVFAVYESGVRMYVDDFIETPEGKGNKSGFAIGGLTGQKEGEGSTEYFRVTPDSVRIYLRESTNKSNKGGFAIGGYTGQKSDPVDVMYVSQAYTRIYIDTTLTKGDKSGFAIGGYTGQKQNEFDFLSITPNNVRFNIVEDFGKDEKSNKSGFAIGGYTGQKENSFDLMYISPEYSRIYIDTTSKKSSKSGFAIGGYTGQKGDLDFLTVSRDSTRIYIDTESGKGNKGGFAIGGFTGQKQPGPEFMRVTRDSTRIYIDTESTSKGNKGGFAIGGLTGQKADSMSFMFLTPDNYFIGHKAGMNTVPHPNPANDGGRYNSFIGYESGKANFSGKYNTFMGYQTGLENTGSDNTFIGYKAGSAHKDKGGNVYIGSKAGLNATEGQKNVYIGELAGASTTTGQNNIFLGLESGFSSLGGSYNIFMGVRSGRNNETGESNIFIGNRSGFSNTDGTNNVFIGNQAGHENISGAYNTFMGFEAGFNNKDSSNTFIGYQAGRSHNSRGGNVYIGSNAGLNATNGMHNVYIGESTGLNTTYGTKNVFIGYESGLNNKGDQAVEEKGSYNVYLGYQAGKMGQMVSRNVFLGYQAGMNTREGASPGDGSTNVFIGSEAGLTNTTGSQNTAIGEQALKSNTTGRFNVALGRAPLINNTDGQGNIALGNYSLAGNTSGSANIGLGSEALNTSLTGHGNVAIGPEALKNSKNDGNTAVGRYALRELSGGSNNTAIGFGATVSPLGTYNNSTAIGNGATITASNQIVIGNSSVSSVVINGIETTTTTEVPNVYINSTGQLMKSTSTGGGGGGVSGSGQAGKLAVWDGTTSLSSNTSLHWDNVNARLGIGKEIPETKVHILQPGTNLGFRIEKGNGNYWGLGAGITNDNKLYFLYNGVSKAEINDLSGTYSAISDLNLKSDIQPLGSVLEKVLLLKPSSFFFKSDVQKSVRSIGFIAQEVEWFFPELVSEFDSGDNIIKYKGLSYDGFAVLSIQAIIDLNTKLEHTIIENKSTMDEQSKTINELQNQVTDLKARLERLEQLLQK